MLPVAFLKLYLLRESHSLLGFCTLLGTRDTSIGALQQVQFLQSNVGALSHNMLWSWKQRTPKKNYLIFRRKKGKKDTIKKMDKEGKWPSASILVRVPSSSFSWFATAWWGKISLVKEPSKGKTDIWLGYLGTACQISSTVLMERGY